MGTRPTFCGHPTFDSRDFDVSSTNCLHMGRLVAGIREHDFGQQDSHNDNKVNRKSKTFVGGRNKILAIAKTYAVQMHLLNLHRKNVSAIFSLRFGFHSENCVMRNQRRFFPFLFSALTVNRVVCRRRAMHMRYACNDRNFFFCAICNY